MVFVWIGIGIGILVPTILIKKIIKTSPKDSFKFSPYCKKCGSRTNGLKCQKCESTSNQQSWK